MLVSIITPYFKSKQYIQKTINSVMKQSHTNWELLIIDDENSINSKKVLKKFISKKIKVYINKNNLGVASSRNKGMRFAKGNVCCFLDSDDTWKKNKLQKQLEKFIKNKSKASYTSYRGIKNKKEIYKVSAKSKLVYEDLLKQNPICCSSVMLHKEIYKKYKFDENLKTKEDYDLWLKIVKKYEFDNVKNILVNYTVRRDSLSSKQFNKIFNAYKIYRSNQDFSILYSIFYILRLYSNAILKKFFNSHVVR